MKKTKTFDSVAIGIFACFVVLVFSNPKTSVFCIVLIFLVMWSCFSEHIEKKDKEKIQSVREKTMLQTKQYYEQKASETKEVSNETKKRQLKNAQRENDVIKNLTFQINKFLKKKGQSYSWDFVDLRKVLYDTHFQIKGKIGSKVFIAAITKDQTNAIQTIYFHKSLFKPFERSKKVSVPKTPRLPENYNVRESAENWISINKADINQKFTESLKIAVQNNTVKKGYSILITNKQLPQYKEVWNEIGNILVMDEDISSFVIDVRGLTLEVK